MPLSKLKIAANQSCRSAAEDREVLAAYASAIVERLVNLDAALHSLANPLLELRWHCTTLQQATELARVANEKKFTAPVPSKLSGAPMEK